MKHVDGLSAAATGKFVAVGPSDRNSQSRLVLTENPWRKRPMREGSLTGARDVILSRWATDTCDSTLEVHSSDAEACHVVSITLKPVSLLFRWGTKSLKASAPASSMMVTGPRDHDCHAVYRDPVDLFRVYVPPALLTECMEGLFAASADRPPDLCGAEVVKDDILLRLVSSLVNVETYGGRLAPTFIEGVGIALAARLISLYSAVGGVQREPRRRALAAWRLERVKDYIEANFERTLTLDELSKVAGLSRIRFGEQFREAMNITPYAYVLQRRIVFAQQLMREPEKSLAEIALLAGFSSQAHFTTVFTRLTGISPGQWRRPATSTAPAKHQQSF